MAVQLGDLDFWSEELYRKHRDLVVEKLGKVYGYWSNALYSAFKKDHEMLYASYYAIVFSSRGVFVSPVMGVCDFDKNKKEGYVCIHPMGVYDALYLIRNFVKNFFEKHSGSGSLFGHELVIDYLNSHMGNFIYEVLIDRENGEEFEDMFDEDFEEVRCLFYYGSWLAWIKFEPDGGYLIDEYNLPCEYRTPSGTYEDSSEEVFGFIVIPRADVFKLLEEQGLVIS